MPRIKYHTEEERLEAKRMAWRRWAAKTDRKKYHKAYDATRLRTMNAKFKHYQNREYCEGCVDKRKVYKMWKGASDRKQEFTITTKDIPYNTNICPCCNEEMLRPSIDRSDSTKGYIPGNIAVICWSCNIIKNNGTAKRHRQIAEYMESLGLE